MHVCALCICLELLEVRIGVESPEPGVIDNGEPLGGCWQLTWTPSAFNYGAIFPGTMAERVLNSSSRKF